MRTNATVEVIRKETNWEGKVVETSLGSYECWVEERTEIPVVALRGEKEEVELGRGIVFFDSNVGVEGAVLKINGVEHDVVSIERFYEEGGTFHHMEVVYR